MVNTELVLGISHCSFLKCREKVLISKKLDNLQALTVLSIEDISFLVGRAIRYSFWQPDLLRKLVDQDIELMNRYGISCVPVMSCDFPPQLREIPDIPFSLFWRGVFPSPEKPMVAVVGTRHPSGSGAMTALQFGRELSEARIPLVSGLANGIDAFAHKGVSETRGVSVAVLACGPDRIYPRSNVRLAGKLLEHGGCIISEYPPGELPLKYRFPQRNRIISGLSRSVVVVEAPEKSGALITADFALEQGRDLFVCEQMLKSRISRGTRNLQIQGAQAIRSVNDIVRSWGGVPVVPDSGIQTSAKEVTGVSGVGRQLALEFQKEFPRFMSLGN